MPNPNQITTSPDFLGTPVLGLPSKERGKDLISPPDDVHVQPEKSGEISY